MQTTNLRNMEAVARICHVMRLYNTTYLLSLPYNCQWQIKLRRGPEAGIFWRPPFFLLGHGLFKFDSFFYILGAPVGSPRASLHHNSPLLQAYMVGHGILYFFTVRLQVSLVTGP